MEHVAIPDGQIHEPKGITTAASGATYVSDGLGSGAWEIIASTSATIVRTVDDFGVSVGDVVTLSGVNIFIIDGTVALGNVRFFLEDGASMVLTGQSTLSDILTSTWTGDLITGDNCNVTLTRVGISAPSARVFNLTATSSTTAWLILNASTILSCRRAALCDKLPIFNMSRSLLVSSTESPAFAFTGTGTDFVDISHSLFQAYTGTLLDLDSGVMNSFSLVGCRITHPVGGTFISGLAASGNIATGGRGVVHNNTSLGEDPVLSGVDPADSLWGFQGNNKIRNSATRGMLHFSGNTDATVISVADTYTQIDNGAAPPTFTLDATSERVSQPTNDTLQVDTENPLNTRVQANVSVRTVSGGGNKSVAVAVFEDSGAGFAQVGSIESDSDIGVAGGVIVVSAPISTESGHKYQIRIKNITDTTNLIVDSIQFYLG